MSFVKYRVKEVAADFGVAPKEISEIVGKYGEKPKSYTQVMTDAELNVVFDYMTQKNQISSMEQIFAVKATAPKAEPKAEAKPEPQKEAPKPAAQQPKPQPNNARPQNNQSKPQSAPAQQQEEVAQDIEASMAKIFETPASAPAEGEGSLGDTRVFDQIQFGKDYEIQ